MSDYKIGNEFLPSHPAPTAPHHAMLDSHRRLVEQAIQSAEHPSGMSTHDGKARIDASILRRMLAIIDSLSAVPAGWKLVPVEPTPEMLGSVGMMDSYDWHAPGCSPDADHANWYSAMIAAAPAAPQAEPMADSDADYWLRNRQAILDAIERAGFVLMSNASGFWMHPRGATDAQAEPKREPLSDERIAEIQRAAYERAAQECIETAAELRRCADGCTDGRYDWKADGADDCADAIRALGRQHD